MYRKLIEKDGVLTVKEEKKSDAQLQGLAKRIRLLSDDKLDILWFKCGFIYSDKNLPCKSKHHKALPQYFIKKIRTSEQEAQDVLCLLLDETPLDMFEHQLKLIEDTSI
ncbi:MAG: hypothetical protein ACMXYC_01755 [Candidatus Woesearchaeota archaeon]